MNDHLRLTAVILASALIASPTLVGAEESKSTLSETKEVVKEGAQKVGEVAKETTTAIGHGTRDAAKAIGHGTRDTVHAVGDAVKKAWNEATETESKTQK